MKYELNKVSAISAGFAHTMFFKDDGSAYATGNNSYGAHGDGTTTARTSPVFVMTGISKISAARYYTLIVKDGAACGVGYNGYGQLASGNTSSSSTPLEMLDFELIPLSGISAISAGQLHSVILKNDGTILATGFNSSGQLGNGTTSDVSTPVQIHLP